MSHIIVSLTVTDLDDFRRYRDDEEMSLADLLKRLRREEGPSDVMRAGSALHKILERPESDELAEVELDGHRFMFSLNESLSLLPFREVSAKREYRVGGETVELRGRADEMGGLTVADHKFTTSPFDAERYFSKYQWRAYLSLFGARTFVYNVFPAKFMGTDEAGVMVWEIREFHPLTLYRYPEMETDIVRELGEYVTFARRHLLGIAA